ncbi:MAG TPA: adenylate/guanylate cyclase domain-containing protein [Chthonomonadaceae bacterium]|nr:adenylate/guanylate cyclase domain-containing protein [Chthonomonadaceae bacterium]
MDQPGRILVVDDELLNRELLGAMIEIVGHEMIEAENGVEALEKAGPGVDLVLLDIMMPGMDGIEVLRRLKADEARRHIPVVVISALSALDTIVTCIELGADDYLPKPFNQTLLKARIGACLEKKRLRDRERDYLRQIEMEKQRSDELLHVILPHEIVQELRATNTVKPRRYEPVAVLFCDIVEFTPYCAARPPEEVICQLQELVETYEDLCLQHDLQKIKTIGDAFMATAGLLKPVENPVLCSVRCGLEMIAATRRLSAAWNVRVGIHVGPVVAGVVGHRQYLFDLWGDTVNTAARIESHGVRGAVNVSRDAWPHIAGHFQAESLGGIPVKGKGEMELFAVKG